MNSALLYRQRGRSIFWIAFMTALAIHLGAVALAKTKSPIHGVEDLSPPADAVIVDIAEPAFERREESVTPPPLEQIHPDPDNFQEESLTTPPPVRAHRRARLPTLVAAGTTSLRAVRAAVVYAPRPVYPYDARRQRLTGSGVALLTVDRGSGSVTDVEMTQSCGSAILDNSTADALRRWRFKAASVSRVRVPITYTLVGASY
jgi:TonB family protein